MQLLSSSCIRRRVIRAGLRLILALSVLGLCLFGDCQSVRSSGVVGSILGEVTAALSDAGTQWMVFACAGAYFLTFLVLRRRLAGGGRTGTRWNESLPDELWLLGLLALAAVAYALGYAEAVKSTQALTLLGGALLGQGAALWEGRRKNAGSRSTASGIVTALVILLAGAAVWQADTGHLFQYRGQGRWSGPWDNPNTFGMLMGVGVVLSAGMLMERLKAKGQRLKTKVQGASNAEVSQWRWCALRWLGCCFLLAAAGVMGWGLVKSYSRGAWLGAACGLSYFVWFVTTVRVSEQSILGDLHCGGLGKPISWFILLVVSICVLGFWTFRDTERLVARRAFSVGNLNDFSWRNRVSAYEGSLQMMASKPWLGFGWNQAEQVYDQFYRKPQVAEGAAIQLNDYFTLGIALGAPALLCFVMYVGLALTCRPSSVLCGPPVPTDYRSLTTDYCLKLVSRSAALVLLVGFWFDGGLFKLATAAPFWILLELGRVGSHETHEAHEND
jgi:hypothetical protein